MGIVKNWICFATCLMLGFTAEAQVKILSYSATEQVLEITFPKVTVSTVERDNNTYSILQAEHATKSNNIAEPDILYYALRLACPNNLDPEIEILSRQTSTQQLTHHLIPSQGHKKHSSDFVVPPLLLGDVYHSQDVYPSNFITWSKPYIMRSARGKNALIAFTQYNPSNKTLSITNKLTIKVRFTKPATENLLQQNITESQPSMMALINKFDNNPPPTPSAYNALPATGDMLVICPNDYLSTIQEFVDWKNTKGIKTKLVSTSTINGNANDTLETAKLQSFINSEFTANPKLLYVQLVGDHHIIETQRHTYAGGSMFYGDNRYGYLAGSDNYAEVLVGRFYCRNVDELKLQVKKAIAYERTPNMSDAWLRSFTAVASNDPTPGDDNQLDWQHIRDLSDSMISHGNYTKKWELYDGSQGGLDAAGAPTPQMFQACIDSGTSFICYAGHGVVNALNTTGFSSAECGDLNNTNGTWPAIIVVGCKTGDFEIPSIITCLGHAMSAAQPSGGNYTQPTGAIVSAMSTEEQWWEAPPQCQDEAMAVYRGARPAHPRNSFGGIMQCGWASMMDQYGAASGWQWPDDGNQMVDAWQIFGDISVTLFNKNEGSLACTHPGTMHSASSTFTVNVNTNDALVALSSKGKLLGTASSSGGQAVVNITSGILGSGDTVTVTATKFNHEPYSGMVFVNGWPASLNNVQANKVSIYPNPAHKLVNVVSAETISNIQIINSVGALLIDVLGSGTTHQSISTEQLVAGTYTLRIYTPGGVTQKLLSVQH